MGKILNIMDYTKIPRNLIYETRFSLNDFGVYDNHPVNTPFVEKLYEEDIVKGSNAEKIVLQWLNNANYITTMVLLEKDPRWRNSSYIYIANNNASYHPNEHEYFTLILVIMYLEALANDLNQFQKELYGKICEYASKLEYNYHSAESWIPKNVTLHKEDFPPRYIDMTALKELDDIPFKWVTYTDYFKERIVRETIDGLGRTFEEKIALLNDIDDSANAFYTDSPHYQNVVRKRFEAIRIELKEKYNSPIITQGEAKTEPVQADAPAQQNNTAVCEDLQKRLDEKEARIKELETKVKELEAKVEELCQPVKNLSAGQKVRMELAFQLLSQSGMTVDVLRQYGKKQKAARVMSLLLDIKNDNSKGNEAQTCATYISARDYSYKRYRAEIKEINSILSDLEIDIQL